MNTGDGGRITRKVDPSKNFHNNFENNICLKLEIRIWKKSC